MRPIVPIQVSLIIFHVFVTRCSTADSKTVQHQEASVDPSIVDQQPVNIRQPKPKDSHRKSKVHRMFQSKPTVPDIIIAEEGEVEFHVAGEPHPILSSHHDKDPNQELNQVVKDALKPHAQSTTGREDSTKPTPEPLIIHNNPAPAVHSNVLETPSEQPKQNATQPQLEQLNQDPLQHRPAELIPDHRPTQASVEPPLKTDLSHNIESQTKTHPNTSAESATEVPVPEVLLNNSDNSLEPEASSVLPQKSEGPAEVQVTAAPKPSHNIEIQVIASTEVDLNVSEVSTPSQIIETESTLTTELEPELQVEPQPDAKPKEEVESQPESVAILPVTVESQDSHEAATTVGLAPTVATLESSTETAVHHEQAETHLVMETNDEDDSHSQLGPIDHIETNEDAEALETNQPEFEAESLDQIEIHRKMPEKVEALQEPIVMTNSEVETPTEPMHQMNLENFEGYQSQEEEQVQSEWWKDFDIYKSIKITLVTILLLIPCNMYLFQTKVQVTCAESSSSEMDNHLESKRMQLKKLKSDLKLTNETDLIGVKKSLEREKRLAPLKAAIKSIRNRLGDNVEERIRSLRNLRATIKTNQELRSKMDKLRYEHLLMIRNFVDLKNLYSLMRDFEFREAANELGDAILELKVEVKVFEEQIETFKRLASKFAVDYEQLSKVIESEKSIELANAKELAQLNQESDRLKTTDSVDNWKNKVSESVAETDKYYRDYIALFYRLREIQVQLAAESAILGSAINE